MQTVRNDWHSDGHGNLTTTPIEVFSDESLWREKYWQNFFKICATKLQDWQHENEYRIILNSSFFDFDDPADRTLKYNFSDLDGIIFGINTPVQDKIKIIQTVSQKCLEEKRDDFEFFQATYNSETGKIDTIKLDFIKINRMGNGALPA